MNNGMIIGRTATSDRLQIVFAIALTPQKISHTTGARNFKIEHNRPPIAVESLYISKGNDASIKFRSAANRIDVLILVMFGLGILDNASINFERVYSF